MVTHGNQDTRPRRSPQGSGGPTPEANKIGASTPYDFESKNLTAYGGLLPVATLKFLPQLRFKELRDFFFSARLPVANAQWDPLESTCRHASLSIL